MFGLKLCLVLKLCFCSDFKDKFSRFGQDFEVEIQAKFEAEVWSLFCCRCLAVAMKFILGRDSEARFGSDL